MKGFQNPELVCSATELSEMLEASGPSTGSLVLLDLRPAEVFAKSHIPGAVHIDLAGVSLVDTSPAPLEAFMWMIEHLLGSRGVTSDRTVVVYDERTGPRAARAFWFLEYFGHPSARVLDGGFGAWTQAGLPVTAVAMAPLKSVWTVRAEHDERLATWTDVQARLERDDCVMLDTRSDSEYYGEELRAKRGGAVPGAVHVEWVRNLDDRGEFKSAGELRALYEPLGVTPDREIIAYCQAGYRAAHSYLALRLLGYPRVRNYLGSWKEWGDRVDLRLERPGRP
jgi:thiosulfate/3-mercaptopyruvate sulfurtransferase